MQNLRGQEKNRNLLVQEGKNIGYLWCFLVLQNPNFSSQHPLYGNILSFVCSIFNHFLLQKDMNKFGNENVRPFNPELANAMMDMTTKCEIGLCKNVPQTNYLRILVKNMAT